MSVRITSIDDLCKGALPIGTPMVSSNQNQANHKHPPNGRKLARLTSELMSFLTLATGELDQISAHVMRM